MEKHPKRRMSRRDFLALSAKLTLAGSTASIAAACVPQTAGPQVAPTSAPSAPAASEPGASPVPAGPQPGGSSVWAHEIQVTSLNPITSPEGSYNAFCELAYEGLTEFDAGLNIVPALAESWETPDQTTYVFHLRENVQWHDGSPFTAEDVKYTFDWILDPGKDVYWRANFDQVDRVEVVDANTVRFITKEPFPPLLAALAIRKNSAIVKQGSIDKPETNNQMNGTGPFKQVDYVPGSHMQLVRNEAYWGAPLPYIQDLTYKLLLDEDARVAALRSGQVDYARITVEGQQRLADQPNLVFTTTPGMRIIALKFNMNREPWNNMRIRQAANLAIDRQEIIEKALSGAGTVSGPLPAAFGDWSVPLDELTGQWYKHDPEQAKQILQEEGYSVDQPIDLLTAPWSVYDIPISTVVAEQLRRVGINVEIRQVETGVYSKEENPPVINFDLAVGGFSARHDPDGYLWQRLFTDGGKNAFSNGYVNTELDGVLLEARQTLDAARRKELYDQAQQIVLEEVPFAWLVTPNLVEAFTQRVKGYQSSPLEYRGWGLTHTYLEG